MPLPSSLLTERLYLRPARIDDAEAICASWANDQEVTRYLGWRPYDDVEVAREFLRNAQAGWPAGDRLWGIEGRHDQRLIGQIGAHPEGTRVVLGYVLARAHWGQGFMTEALRAVAGAALDDPAIYRAWAVCDVDNPASARVMQKAGMRFEGRLRRWIIHPNVSPEPRDVLCYAKVR